MECKFIIENPIEMEDLGGKTPIFGNTHEALQVLGTPVFFEGKSSQ